MNRYIYAFLGAILVILLCGLKLSNANKADTTIDMQIEAYGDVDNLFYVSEDYVVNDLVVLEQGYYESVNLKGTTKNVFIPIEPDTKKRLPSEKISEGTLMEIDGENYRVHVSNNEYSATLEEN